jgi:hypothetical protein
MSMFKNQKLYATALLFSFGCTTAEPTLTIGQSSQPAAAAVANQASKPASLAGVKSITAPITGTIGGLPFAGLMHVTEFVREGNQIFGLATLSDITGTSLAKSTTAQLVESRAKIPLTFPEGGGGATLLACDILALQLGPIDLDLLGLVVHLDQVNLDITADQGPGDLLGNLLCAITGLLDPGLFGLVLGVITNLLNAILAVVGTL